MADKGGGEIRIGCLRKEGFQERKAGSLHGGEQAEPFLLLHRKSCSQRRSWERVMEKRSQSLSTVEGRRKYSARTRRMKNRP